MGMNGKLERIYISILENKLIKKYKMKTIKFVYLKFTFLLGLIFSLTISCERNISDDAVLATFPKTAEIFTDGPVGLGSNFYFPYAPSPDNPVGSKLDAWSVDTKVSYKGSASMRFDVPDSDNPEGNYAGGIFRIDGAGRNLTDYDALTFWAKASQNVSIAEIGFGEDFYPNKYIATLQKVSLTTNWVKYVIPIPDASKLVQEKGMLRYAAGGTGIGTVKKGYNFWIDELKFEKLGTLAHPRPAILNGSDDVVKNYLGASILLTGLTQTFNLANGFDQTVLAAPSYFTFKSSDETVAKVSTLGVVTVVGSSGTAKITATLAGTDAKGSLTITSLGSLLHAPIPTTNASNVKSIYSDTYTAITGSNFDPKFGGSTTQTSEVTINSDSVRFYTNNNYTGIMFNNIVDASTLTRLHIDIFSQNFNTTVGIQIRDIGANGIIDTDIYTGYPIGDDKDFRFTATGITVGVWKSFDIILGGNISFQKNHLGAIILTGGPDFILDNIYFY